MPKSRSPFLSVVLAFSLAALFNQTASAQRGQFDKTPIVAADEAYIFTPPGFDHEGKVATADGPDAAHLEITIVDKATGQPTYCRVNVVGPDGNFYQPSDNPLAQYSLNGTWPDSLAGNRPAKAPIRYFGRFFYTTGKFNVAVPAGKVRVEVWKGFEYRPVTQTINLAAGDEKDLHLTLKRTAPLAEQGWYSGDPHLHFIRASDQDDATVFDLLEAEDMRFGMVLAYNETNDYPGMMPELITPQLRGLGTRSIRRRDNYQIISGQEYRNVVSGHMLLYLRDSLVLDGQHIDPNLGPVFGDIASETRQQGGYAFHAHGGYAQEIWADLVQGATNGVELFQFGIYRGIGLEGWYHVLNSGFRFPGIGACDYPACRKLGDSRTYVHIAGEPTFENWLAAAAAGRSFMTSGPLILLDVDGKVPGDVIAKGDAKPSKLTARVTVHHEVCPVSEVQLIVSGQVVHTVRPQLDGDNKPIVVEKTLNITEPSWIAARAFSTSPTGSPDGDAHTNPVYVELGGKRPFSEQSIDWLIQKIDEQIVDHAAREVPERTKSVEYFRRSREILVEAKERGQLAQQDPASHEDPALANQQASDEDLAEFLKPVPAKSPEEALQTFEVLDGFHLEVAACEPDVTDPVAACFDENGGMYVAEMTDYPYRPQDGKPLGRVRYLQDTDDDGRYDKSWIFADGLAWPTGLVCWKGGVYVAAAPDIWYCRDTDGDHLADQRERVYTGFGDRNQQGGVNNLNWGIDHKIYGAGSTNGGEIRPATKRDAQPIVLSGRDFRFDPVTGAFETITGREQFGNAFDDWFNRFICSESNPLVAVVLPQEYLARNPFLAVPSGLKDLSPGVTPIFRISPIERWRQIRSTRRLAAGERSSRSAGLSHNVMDAAAGLTVYRGHAYPEKYHGDVFVGCSQNNLIHHRKLIADGVTFRSERADEGTEFVRSSDTWFRPVNCINAPDGTLYVLDMSREVIESIHIANDVVKHLDLTSGRDRGRIYRLAPPGFRSPPQPKLGSATATELVALLEHPGGWWRDTAGRLIFERQDKSAVDIMRSRLREAASAVGRMHLMYALAGLDALSDDDLLAAMADDSPRVRDHAMRLTGPRLDGSPPILNRVASLASDDDPGVRFQAAFALGQSNSDVSTEALAAIAARDAADYWTRTAVLSSCAHRSGDLLRNLVRRDGWSANTEAPIWCRELSTIVGARNDSSEVTQTLKLAATLPVDSPAQEAILLGIGGGLKRTGTSVAEVAASSDATGLVSGVFERAAKAAADGDQPLAKRLSAIQLLGQLGSNKTVNVLLPLVDSREPETLLTPVLRTLANEQDPAIAKHVIRVWRQATPKVQEEMTALLVTRANWAAQLIDACEDGSVIASQISGPRRVALLNHQDKVVQARAQKLFAADSGPRAEVIARYQSVLALSGDATRGDRIYERECMICHRLENRGFDVGPNLALVRNRTDGAMIDAILDPNREVHPSFVNYVVIDTSGRTSTGLIRTETANSIALLRDKGASETILKQDIEELRSTGKSLMPEGLEKNITPQELADLLAFLKQMQYDIGTRPDFAEPED